MSLGPNTKNFAAAVPVRHDFTTEMHKGPGLRKASNVPAYLQTNVMFLRSEDAFWRDAFAAADIVSEGSSSQTSYMGTTSILLHLDDRHGHAATIAERCMHVRLRALRIARREAQNRAGRSLHPSRCDVHFLKVASGVKIEVNVEANLVERRLKARNAP